MDNSPGWQASDSTSPSSPRAFSFFASTRACQIFFRKRMKVSPLLLPARRPRVLTCQMFATFVRLYLAHEPAELRYGRSTAPAPAATSEVAPRAAEDAWATTRDGRFFTSVLSSSPVRRWSRASSDRSA